MLKASEADSPEEEHKGSEKSWLEGVQEKAEEAVGKLEGSDQWHIYTTGHSMGGALATLCAHELAVRIAVLALSQDFPISLT